MSHISCVQTLVKASGKKSSTVFFLPKLLLSFTSTRPDACLDLRVKSGAFVPTGNAIISGCLINCGLVLTRAAHCSPQPFACQLVHFVFKARRALPAGVR